MEQDHHQQVNVDHDLEGVDRFIRGGDRLAEEESHGVD